MMPGESYSLTGHHAVEDLQSKITSDQGVSEWRYCFNQGAFADYV